MHSILRLVSRDLGIAKIGTAWLLWGVASIAQAQTVDDIVQRHIEARGGTAAIERSRSMRMTGVLRQSMRMPVRFVNSPVAPRGSRLEFAIDGRPAVQCFDGTSGSLSVEREAQGLQGPRVDQFVFTSNDLELDALRSQEDWLTWPIDYSENNYRLDLLDSDVGGRFKLQLTKPNGDIDLIYIAHQTYHQVLRIENRFNGREQIVRRIAFGSFKNVDGVPLPHTIQQTVGDESAEVSIETIQLGAPRVACPRVSAVAGGHDDQREIFLKDKHLEVPSPVADHEIRIGLVVPTNVTEPTWTHTHAGSRLMKLKFADAFAAALEKLVCGAFPNCHIADSRDELQDVDLVVEADLRANPVVAQSSDSAGLTALSVATMLRVTDVNGRDIDRIYASYTAKVEKAMVWSEETKGRGLGKRALTELLHSLAERLASSRDLVEHRASLAEARALPSRLQIEVAFDDRGALFQNAWLDAGEGAFVKVTVLNTGSGPAFDTRIRAESETPGIASAGTAEIGTLPPGERRTVELPIQAAPDLADGPVRVRVECTDRRGFGARPMVLEVPGRALRPPALDIVDVQLVETAGAAGAADQDGLPGAGETLEAVVRIRNRGSGDAAGVSVSLKETPRVERIERQVTVPRVGVHEVAEARFRIELPRLVGAGELSLAVEAVDARGAGVGIARGGAAWPFVARAPVLEIARQRLYDGDSPHSSGDRDGRLSNGERAEIAFTVANRGDLEARDVRLEVQLDDNEIQVEPRVLEVGRLPAGAEGAEQRLLVEIPRWLERKAAERLQALPLAIFQSDFPARRTEIPLPFQLREPRLDVSIELPPRLTQGGTAEGLLTIRNAGELAAQEVNVEIASTVAGLRLLDERGAVRETLAFVIGKLPAGGRSPSLRFGVQALRGAPPGEASLQVAVRQMEFPPIETRISVAVQEETAELVATRPAEDMIAGRGAMPVSTAQPVLAALTFLDPPFGANLSQDVLNLRFEVQYAGALAELRLLHNGRSVALGPPAGSTRLEIGGVPGHADVYQVPLALTKGENQLEVVAITSAGERTARSHVVHQVEHPVQIWVAAIGIDDYAHPSIPDLSYAEADARAVYDYYRNGLGLPEDRVFLLAGAEATLANVKNLLGTRIARRATNPRDTVILFFAGHGYREIDPATADSDGFSKYLLPYDANPEDLYSSSLAMDEVTTIVRRIRAERVVFLVDSCFSGNAGGRTAVDPGGGFRGVVTAEFLDRIAAAGHGRVVLAASAPNEVAQERVELGHGVFTHFLLEALRGAADENRNGLVDVDEAYRFVSEHVHRSTAGRQTPWRKFSDPEAIGEIVIGRAAH